MQELCQLNLCYKSIGCGVLLQFCRPVSDQK
jgi:hypothetical protein